MDKTKREIARFKVLLRRNIDCQLNCLVRRLMLDHLRCWMIVGKLSIRGFRSVFEDSSKFISGIQSKDYTMKSWESKKEKKIKAFFPVNERKPGPQSLVYSMDVYSVERVIGRPDSAWHSFNLDWCFQTETRSVEQLFWQPENSIRKVDRNDCQSSRPLYRI